MNTSNVHVKSFLDNDSETFSYVVYDHVGGHALLIDSVLDFDYKSGRTATTGAQRLLDFVNDNKLTVDWILETHAHADHLSAAPFLREQTGAKVAIGAHIKDVQKIFKDVFDLEKTFLPDGQQFDHLFNDGDSFQCGALQVRVIHTPGHTPADLAYLINDSAVFVGDTLFQPDVGTARCDFPGGSSKTLYQSIRKLLSLADDTHMYVCHDYPKDRDYQPQTTVAAQREHNIHVHDGVNEAEFCKMRDERDATLEMPHLILPSIQVNIRAGHMPPADERGKIYLKLPINQL